MVTRNERYDEFDRLMQKHGAYIRRLCWWRSSGRSEDCADLIQECLLHLWHYRHTLRPDSTESQERLWVKYHCRSVFSHQKDTRNEDRRRMLEEMAYVLNEQERRVMTLLLDGYTRPEIAEMLGTTAKHVSQIRYRIIEKMKKTI